MNRPTAAQNQGRGGGAGVGMTLRRDGISFDFFSQFPTTEPSVASDLFKMLYPNFGEPETPTRQQLSARRYGAANYLLGVLISSSTHPQTGRISIDAGYGFKVQYIHPRVSPAKAGGVAKSTCVTLSKQPKHTALVGVVQPVIVEPKRTSYEEGTNPTQLNPEDIISSLRTAVDCLRQEAGIHLVTHEVASVPCLPRSGVTRFEDMLARVFRVDPR